MCGHYIDLPDEFHSFHLNDDVRQELPAIWWRLRGEGVRLPPEIGVIVVTGGRP